MVLPQDRTPGGHIAPVTVPGFALALLRSAIARTQRASRQARRFARARRLTLPILAIGGAHSLGEQVADTMKLAADDVQSLVIPGSGRYCLEESPEEVAAALTAFLDPYQG